MISNLAVDTQVVYARDLRTIISNTNAARDRITQATERFFEMSRLILSQGKVA